MFSCVTGVSGSGKSTLVNQVLVKALSQRLRKVGREVVERDDRSVMEVGIAELNGRASFGRVKGTDELDKLVVIDQSPIGRTPRSNDPLRIPEPSISCVNSLHNFRKQKFAAIWPVVLSFNVKGGRCEACQGDGIIKIEMHFPSRCVRTVRSVRRPTV